MSDIGDDALKWLEENDRINKNPSLTDVEVRTLDELGKKLFVSDLSTAFLKAMQTKTPQTISFLEDEDNGELLEELKIEGNLIPAMDMSRRNMQVVISFNRLKPQTDISPLLRTVFTQACALDKHRYKNVDQEELHIISDSFVTDKIGRKILPVSPLAAVQGLVSLKTSQWSTPPSDKNTNFLDRQTKLTK